MSYDKTIDGHAVKFREEEDYLECRLQFLRRGNWDTSSSRFLQFIQQQEYDEQCVVENIGTPDSITVPLLNSSNVVGDSSNDYYSAHFVNSFPSYGYLEATHAYHRALASSVSTGSGFLYYDVDTNNTTFLESSFVLEPSVPALEPPEEVEEKKEEPPGDRIENRWEILDL